MIYSSLFNCPRKTECWRKVVGLKPDRAKPNVHEGGLTILLTGALNYNLPAALNKLNDLKSKMFKIFEKCFKVALDFS